MLNSVLTTSPQTLGQMADEFRLNVRKWFNFFLPRKTFLTLGRVDCCFDDACSKCLTTGQFFSSTLSENEEKIIYFFLICFPQTVPMDKWNAILLIVTKISWMKAGKCSPIVRKRYEILIFENKNFFPDMFLGTPRMQFRQQLKKFRQQAEIVCSTSKNDRRNTLFLEVFFQNCSSGQVEWKHCGKPNENS